MNELFTNKTSANCLPVPDIDSVYLDSTKVDWQACGAEGFMIKALLEDSHSGIRTWLMKVERGAFSDLHCHEEIEQIYVLEGSFYDQHKTYQTGEFIVRAPGAMHTAGSVGGALVLLFYSR